MGFFDGFGKTVTDAGQKTVQKTKDMSETVKINSLISEEKKKMAKIYMQIGKQYVDIYGSTCDEEFEELVDQALESQDKIDGYHNQLQNLKRELRCAACGSEIQKGDVFCSVCGTKIIRNQETENGAKLRCPFCGNYEKRGMNFCTKCGNSLIDRSNEREEERNEITKL